MEQTTQRLDRVYSRELNYTRLSSRSWTGRKKLAATAKDRHRSAAQAGWALSVFTSFVRPCLDSDPSFAQLPLLQAAIALMDLPHR